MTIFIYLIGSKTISLLLCIIISRRFHLMMAVTYEVKKLPLKIRNKKKEYHTFPPNPHRSSLLRIHLISHFKLDVFFSLAVAALQIFILNSPRLCCSCINTLFFYYRNFDEIILSQVAHAPELPRLLHHFYKILHCNLSYNGIVPWHMKYQDKLYSSSLSKYALNCVWVFRNILINI